MHMDPDAAVPVVTATAVLQVTVAGTTYLPLAAYSRSRRGERVHLAPPAVSPSGGGAAKGRDGAVRLGGAGWLDLRWCALPSVPEWLGQLQHVVALDLSHNPLAIVPFAAVAGLAGLCSIAVRHTELVNFFPDVGVDPGSAVLALLHTVDLRGNPAALQVPGWLSSREGVRVHLSHQRDAGGGAAAAIPASRSGWHPPLREQLDPHTTGEFRRRLLHVFGVAPETVRRLPDRTTVLDAVCFQYARRFAKHQGAGKAGRPTTLWRGQAVPPALIVLLQTELETMAWPPRQRPRLDSGDYMTLGKPPAEPPQDGSRRRYRAAVATFERYRRLWEIARQILESVDPAFAYTEIAVTRNFRGSPHVDVNDISFQYALSVGGFRGGGRLCVEVGPTEVAEIETRNVVAKMDGRFPHWVTDYNGSRYSIIWYKTHGHGVPRTEAVYGATEGP